MFKSIKPEEITNNVFELIGSDWMLITAGPPERHNTMTASWGGFGVIWNKNICWCVIRPERYTREFVESSDAFTLSFFDESHRQALEICGTKSGRDINKAEVTGLTPVPGTLPGATYFSQARMVIECRKIYFQDIIPEHFLDPASRRCILRMIITGCMSGRSSTAW